MPVELVTERLRLRALDPDDLCDLHDRVFMDIAFGDLGLTTSWLSCGQRTRHRRTCWQRSGSSVTA